MQNDQQIMFFEEYIDALIDRRMAQVQNPEYTASTEERCVQEVRKALEESFK